VSRPLRLGAVAYLNARPLVFGLESTEGSGALAADADPAITIRFDVPSVCAQLLADGAIDLGLVPSISYLEGSATHVVPDVSISSVGPVASVALFTRRPLAEIRTMALDTSSRTSAALTRILCARRFGVSPSFVPHAPDLAAMLAACDAALLIGDPALFVDHRAHGAEKIDLGEAWTDLTGLPFVWAFWAGGDDAVDAKGIARLQAARDAGGAASAAIADAYCVGDPARQALARRYLRENIRYGLSDDALRGLQTFYREAAALGIVKRSSAVTFYRPGAVGPGA